MNNSQIRILVVDDDETVRLNLSLYLEDEGFEVMMADSGEQALKIMAKDPIHASIIDIRLPGMDGNNLIIKAHELQAGIKFLIHTGSLDYELSAQLVSLGLTRAQVLNKPLPDMSIIVRSIKDLIKEQKE